MSTPYDITPRKVTEDLWVVENAAGDELALAGRDELSGVWTAFLNPKLCAEAMNFLSSQSDNPASALETLISCNLQMAKEIVFAIEDINVFMNLDVFEEDEVEVDILATA
jgi:hypothetical protein